MAHTTINTWKSIINTGNHKKLISIIHDNATFHSPIVYTPQEGKKKVLKYLISAVEIFKGKNFNYTVNTFWQKLYGIINWYDYTEYILHFVLTPLISPVIEHMF